MKTLNDIGEKNFIKELLSEIRPDEILVNGFGDDISIIDLGLKKNIAMKIDRAPKPLSISQGWSNFKPWGRLAAVTCISDMLCSGAHPKGLMLSMILPGNAKVTHAKEIAFGFEEACKKYDASFIGGDTKEGSEIQAIGACIGIVEKGKNIPRGKASPGDKLVIAGQLGGFLGAYESLKLNKDQKLINFINNPQIPFRELSLIASSCTAKYSCDLSDGLADALNLFCSPSVGITIEESSLPLHPYAIQANRKIGIDRMTLSLSVGDWASAYVVSKTEIQRLTSLIPSTYFIKEVGEFNSTGERKMSLINGKKIDIPNQINEHFSQRLEDDY